VMLQVTDMEKDKKIPNAAEIHRGKLLRSELNDWLEHVWTLRQTTEKEDFPIIKVLVVGMFLSIGHWRTLQSALYLLLGARIYKSSQEQPTKYFWRQPSGGK